MSNTDQYGPPASHTPNYLMQSPPPARHKRRNIHIVAYPVVASFFGIFGVFLGLAVNGSIASTAGQGVENVQPSAKPTPSITSNAKPTHKPEKVPAKVTKLDGTGTYEVGSDIQPGKYKNAGDDFCYWARLRSLDGSLNAIIVNHVGGGQQLVTVKKTDKAFESRGCNDWVKVG